MPLAGAMRAGDSLGDAEVFRKHLGKSQKVNDALIADTAACKADWLVTEDYRLRMHLEKHQNRCNGMTYEYFLEELNAIQ